VGFLLSLIVGVLLWRGWLGDIGRRVAIVAGSATALPLLLVPVIKVGNAVGIQATYGALLAVSLLLAFGLTEHLDKPMPMRAAIAAAVGAACLSAALVVRHALTPELSPDEREPIAVLMAAVALTPALVAAFAERGGVRRRANYVTIGVIPGVASIAIMPSDVQPVLPAVLIVGLLLVHGLPWERLADQVSASFARVRSEASAIGPAGDSAVRERRDLVCIALVGAALFAALTQDAAWAIVLAGIAGLFIFVGVRQGVLGPDWTEAAIPRSCLRRCPGDTRAATRPSSSRRRSLGLRSRTWCPNVTQTQRSAPGCSSRRRSSRPFSGLPAWSGPRGRSRLQA
jgi:hypothetical protein